MMTMARKAKGLALAALLILAVGAAPAPESKSVATADRFLDSPTLDFAQARQALALYEEALATAAAPDATLLARLSQVCFILGELADNSQRQAYYEKGETYADRLLQVQPQGVAGHYWKAMNLCGQAEVGGRLKGMKCLPRIMEELKRAVALDPAYDQAGPHRVLGRIYYEAPRRPLSVGDLQQSREHLTAAVRLAPECSTNHLYLAETLLRLNEPGKARQELQQVLTATRHAVQPQGLEEDRREARRRLAELAGNALKTGP
jgi:tetratricopeptide (TPR) repeat protein